MLGVPGQAAMAARRDDQMPGGRGLRGRVRIGICPSYSQGTLSYFLQRHLCPSVPSEVLTDSTEEGSSCI